MERNPFRSLERQFENLQRQFEAMGDVWDGEQFDVPKTGIATSRLDVDIADRGDEFVVSADLPGLSKATISTFGSRATRYTVPPSTNERSTMRTSTTCRANARDGPCTGPSDSRNRSTKTPSRRRARTASSRSPYPRRNRPLSREQRSTSRRGVDVTFSSPTTARISRTQRCPRDRVRRGARCGHRRGYRHP